MNSACQGNLSACHCGHACLRFVSPSLYQGNIWALLATGNIANEHPTLSFPLLTYKRLKNVWFVLHDLALALLSFVSRITRKCNRNAHSTNCFKHTFYFRECKSTRKSHSIARAKIVAKALLGRGTGVRWSLAAVPKGLQNGRKMGGNEHFK